MSPGILRQNKQVNIPKHVDYIDDKIVIVLLMMMMETKAIDYNINILPH